MRDRLNRLALFGLMALATACAPASRGLDGGTPSPDVSGRPSGASTTAADSGSIKQWDTPPEISVDPDKVYLATFVTEKGDIRVELFVDKAPVTVNNFVFLAREGFYDNTTFHRVLPDFMAQGGDPTGTGTGGPGYQFQDEIHPDLRFDQPGLLAMANAGPNTNGSQFFLTFVPTPHLNGRHTIFGKVVEGMEVLLSLRLRDPQANPDYAGDKLITVNIDEVEESLLPPATATTVPVVPAPEGGRPLARLDIAARENLYTGRPAMNIDTEKRYVATISTSEGDIVVSLSPQEAPESVNNFVVLAELGYWDGFPIAFVDPGKMMIIGSPSGRPESDIGYGLPSEVKLANTAGAMGFVYRQDIVASSGSQFYILLTDLPSLDGWFTVFGHVTDGIDVAAALGTDDRVVTITVEED